VRIEAWLTADRAIAWLRVLAAMTALMVAAWVGLSHAGIDPTGKPLGTDFLSFWTAARLAAHSSPASAYDNAVIGGAQLAAFRGADTGYAPFSYPPTFLLLIAPLGMLPYFPALIAWLGLTGAAFVRVVRSWVREAYPSWLAVLAFPAVFLNLAHGQSAFLTAAIFGAGALLLPRRPLLAGLCLGLLSVKPHLGLLIPFALMASGEWLAIAGAAASSIGLACESLLVFGPRPWSAFLHSTQFMKEVVEQGMLDPAKLQSVFGALRAWHAPLWAAYGAQAAVAMCAGVAVVAVARRRPQSHAVGAVLIAATVLATPYLLDYDLTLIAIPLAWMLSEAVRTRFLPGERLVIFMAYVLPLASRVMAMKLHAPVAVPILVALLFVTVRRALLPREVIAAASAWRLDFHIGMQLPNLVGRGARGGANASKETQEAAG